MSASDDLLDRIDQVTAESAATCWQCKRSLGESVSDDFCSALCQQRWHEARSDLFDDYASAEYGDPFESFAGMDELAAAWRRMGEAGGEVAAALGHLRDASYYITVSNPVGAVVTIRNEWQEHEGQRQMVQHVCEAFDVPPASIGRPDIPDTTRSGRMARALDARRNRNTGPQQRRLPPRSLPVGRR